MLSRSIEHFRVKKGMPRGGWAASKYRRPGGPRRRTWRTARDNDAWARNRREVSEVGSSVTKALSSLKEKAGAPRLFSL